MAGDEQRQNYRYKNIRLISLLKTPQGIVVEIDIIY
jgi:hypothetical protein